jgi:hypothetical protein
MFTCAKKFNEDQQDTLNDILKDLSEDEIKQADKRGREIHTECRNKLKAAEEKK